MYIEYIYIYICSTNPWSGSKSMLLKVGLTSNMEGITIRLRVQEWLVIPSVPPWVWLPTVRKSFLVPVAGSIAFQPNISKYGEPTCFDRPDLLSGNGQAKVVVQVARMVVRVVKENCTSEVEIAEKQRFDLMRSWSIFRMEKCWSTHEKYNWSDQVNGELSVFNIQHD